MEEIFDLLSRVINEELDSGIDKLRRSLDELKHEIDEINEQS